MGPVVPTEIKIKTQAEQIDEMRQNIFDFLDRISTKKQELADKFVPISVCTQLQQAVRDAEVIPRIDIVGDNYELNFSL